jgi:hypothetical protein
MRWHLRLLILTAVLCLFASTQLAYATPPKYPHRCPVIGKVYVEGGWVEGRPITVGRCPGWRTVQLR